MQNPQQNPQQVTIKRDYLAVRDKAFDNICKELKASLPTELSLEVVGINYLQLPVAVVKNPKHKMLFFTTYKEIAEIAFAPDITEISEADFELMSAKEKWSPLKTKPGRIVAICCDPKFEEQLLQVIAQVSTKLKLAQPTLQRKGYDLVS
jgi:hypothetical protein